MGSEMCIRDSSLRFALLAHAIRGFARCALLASCSPPFACVCRVCSERFASNLAVGCRSQGSSLTT